MQKFSKDKERFVIELKWEHKVVGLIHLFQVDNCAVWAYEIGYTYEAVSYVMQQCFDEVQREMMPASVFQRNEKSMRLLNKLGFVKEGITHEAAKQALSIEVIIIR